MGAIYKKRDFATRENIKYISKGAIYKKRDSNNIKIIKYQFSGTFV